MVGRHLGDASFHHREGRLERAIESYREAAFYGSVEAIIQLSEIYYNQGNIEDARKWNEIGANIYKDPTCTHRLGVIHEQDGEIDQAMEWYKKGADLLHSPSMFDVGRLYEREENRLEAKRWYMYAATKGNIDAMNSLGVVYHIEGSIVDALLWFDRAATNGCERAIANLHTFTVDELALIGYASAAEKEKEEAPRITNVFQDILKDECGICLTKLNTNHTLVMTCGHGFHLHCIMNPNITDCPYCNQVTNLSTKEE
jgi:TPR repeat protein